MDMYGMISTYFCNIFKQFKQIASCLKDCIEDYKRVYNIIITNVMIFSILL